MTNLEIQLYTALKGLTDMYVSMVNSGDCGNWDPEKDKEVIAARSAITEVELDLGQLPDWATAHNLAREPVLYAQLCTRDGERMGNAVIANVPDEMSHVYYVITDMGSPMRLSPDELAACFTIGPYIMDKRAVDKRKYQNPEQFGEELAGFYG